MKRFLLCGLFIGYNLVLTVFFLGLKEIDRKIAALAVPEHVVLFPSRCPHGQPFLIGSHLALPVDCEKIHGPILRIPVRPNDD